MKSMTGYGAAKSIARNYELKVEIKSLNGKFLDLTAKIPKEFNGRELEIKSLLKNRMVRGKIGFSMWLTPTDVSQTAYQINKELFQVYFNAYADMASEVSADKAQLFKLALQSPDVLEPRDDFSELIDWEDTLDVILIAVQACDSYRASEGQELKQSIGKNIEAIQKDLDRITALDAVRSGHVRNRLEQGLREISDRVKVDSNRFEQELIYYLDKIDISEEKVRLKSHLDYFLKTMEEEASGKKLGFIAQEIGREMNTIGSKANDAAMQRLVVEMKDKLEQIKEQVFNVV